MRSNYETPAEPWFTLYGFDPDIDILPMDAEPEYGSPSSAETLSAAGVTEIIEQNASVPGVSAPRCPHSHRVGGGLDAGTARITDLEPYYVHDTVFVGHSHVISAHSEMHGALPPHPGRGAGCPVGSSWREAPLRATSASPARPHAGSPPSPACDPAADLKATTQAVAKALGGCPYSRANELSSVLKGMRHLKVDEVDALVRSQFSDPEFLRIKRKPSPGYDQEAAKIHSGVEPVGVIIARLYAVAVTKARRKDCRPRSGSDTSSYRARSNSDASDTSTGSCASDCPYDIRHLDQVRSGRRTTQSRAAQFISAIIRALTAPSPGRARTDRLSYRLMSVHGHDNVDFILGFAVGVLHDAGTRFEPNDLALLYWLLQRHKADLQYLCCPDCSRITGWRHRDRTCPSVQRKKSSSAGGDRRGTKRTMKEEPPCSPPTKVCRYAVSQEAHV